MPSKYTIKIRTKFSGAHILRGYDGPCSRMHGHNWKVEVDVVATELDEVGMGMDFKVIKKATRELAGILDHQYINEISPFDQINPTAENIAKWFYQQLQAAAQSATTKLQAVTIWETDNSAVCYSED